MIHRVFNKTLQYSPCNFLPQKKRVLNTMKILKSIGLYFILPIIFITLGILIHIIYLDLFYPNKYMSSKESSFLTEESQEVVSSSESNIAKTNFENEEPQGYYLTVMEGKIVVMETDQKTIYLTTDIYAEALSESLKQELIKGKFIHSMEELYGFLESYTS